LDQELVDRTQAERILGGAPVMFIGALSPIAGSLPRSSKDSLWRVSDLLEYAKFDYSRYYYSIQDHTIDSDRVLKLLGYPEGAYESLASLYRQGRLKPSVLTEHRCVGNGCSECLKGKKSLKKKGLSLAHRWDDPSVASKVKNLRWNDSQLEPFLRNWHRKNMVSTAPSYIMREISLDPPKKCRKCKSSNIVVKDNEVCGPSAICEKCGNSQPLTKGIDAGLLQFVDLIIEHDVINFFKSIGHRDGVPSVSLNSALSPDTDESEVVAWESDDIDNKQYVIVDPKAKHQFNTSEHRRDARSITDGAGLTDDELGLVEAIHILQMTVKEYSEYSGLKVKSIHKLYNNTMRKIRGESISKAKIDSIISGVCTDHDCSKDDIFGFSVVGKPVVARTQLFFGLYDAGMSIRDISVYFSYPRGRVAAAVHRHHLYNS
jgi:hypothetical protein